MYNISAALRWYNRYPAYNRRSVADHITTRATRQALTVASKPAASSSYKQHYRTIDGYPSLDTRFVFVVR
jgi:hypothetical protein